MNTAQCINQLDNLEGGVTMYLGAQVQGQALELEGIPTI